MGKGLHTEMRLTDLQEAFDTLDHNVLLEKIEIMGFKKTVIKWLKSYPSNRKHFVLLEGVFSEEGIITCAVSQVSILDHFSF